MMTRSPAAAAKSDGAQASEVKSAAVAIKLARMIHRTTGKSIGELNDE
jgi:hypothetical protein